MIPVLAPCVGQEEINAVAEVINSGWLGMGKKVEEFEIEFAKFANTDTNSITALNSCTAALDLACLLAGIKEGDEVLVPTNTFISTAHAVIYNGGTPIFVDINEKLNINIEDALSKLTEKTKAIIPVHFSGRMVDIDYLKQQLPVNIKIIEDCAHAAGSYLRGQHAGTFGNYGCFSFHAVKNLAMGDGGALLTPHYEAARAKRLRWLGIDKSTWDRSKYDEKYWWEYTVDEIGKKNHMNDISAAIGLAQLKKLDKMNARRREIADIYQQHLGNFSWIIRPSKDTKDSISSWHLYVIRVLAGKRNKLAVHLQDNGIGTGVHYKPIHLYNCYHSYQKLPVAEQMFKEILTIPMSAAMTDLDVEKVIEGIKSFKG